ncbi:MAG: glycosyltransferase [Prochloraceae cyanobacterium]
MILITVGTEKFSFNRLMNWLETLILKGTLNPQQEEVVVQYGSCTIIPSQVKSFQVVPGVQFQELVKKARLIIAHCGEGTIDLLSKINKPFLLVPRSVALNEHVDDHQIELANALQDQGINIAHSISD